MDRRTFLKLGAAWALAGCWKIPDFRDLPEVQEFPEIREPVREATRETLNGRETFEEFQNRLRGYESFDNMINNGANEWNMWKYQELAKPLLQWPLDELDIQKMQYLISQEVGSAYDASTTIGFRKYNEERVYNQNTFYGNIPWEPIIDGFWDALYDSRITWNIDFNSPNRILSDLWLPLDQQDVWFVIRDTNGIYIFVYYEGGKLRCVCPCSPGKAALWTTPTSGLAYNEYRDLSHYFLDDDLKNESNETLNSIISSWETIGWSMPYARRILVDWKVDGYYTHIWEVNGQAASHGCIRLPALWAYIMFYEGNNMSNIHYRTEYSV